MIRKATVAVALATMIASACSDLASPTANTPQRYIAATNNDPTSTIWGTYTPLDALLKELYERNNSLSREGEADNTAASNANLNLANVFNNPAAVTLTDARNAMANFIKDVNTAYKSGKYSDCSAPQLLARAAQIDSTYAKVQANNNTLDPSMLPGPANWACDVSPVNFLAATGSVTSGVTLTYSDPWHFDNDPRPDPYHIYTYVTFYVSRYDDATSSWIQLPQQAAWTNLSQTGPATLTFADPTNTTPGTYTYAVQQCDVSFGGCSTWTNGTVIVPDPNAGGGGGGEYGCVHDNRNGFMTKDNKAKDCPKTDKIHPNINGNGKNK